MVFSTTVPPERRTVIWSMPPIAIRERPSRSPDVPFTIGFIGRIVPEKGLENLLDAVAKLPHEGWRLLVPAKVFPPLDLATPSKPRRKAFRSSGSGLFRRPTSTLQIDVLAVPAPFGPIRDHWWFTRPSPMQVPMSWRQDRRDPLILWSLLPTSPVGYIPAWGRQEALRAILAERIRGGRSHAAGQIGTPAASALKPPPSASPNATSRPIAHSSTGQRATIETIQLATEP